MGICAQQSLPAGDPLQNKICSAAISGTGADPYVIGQLPSDRGLLLQNGSLLERFHAPLASCGLPQAAFHSLRQSSITYKLILTCGNIKAVQGDSGHAQADMITEVCGHILDQRRHAGAELFEADFFRGQFPS